ncbi:MAG TPA: RloB family protein [Puia sp.]
MARKGKLKSVSRDAEERPVRIKKYGYLFLIVCEDEKTERVYFEGFKEKIPNETIYLKAVGTGLDPKGVVERAIKERDLLSLEAKKDVDVVWVVFDKDDADKSPGKRTRYAEAFAIAQTSNLRTAYSNEVFEVWLLLHLIELDPEKPLPRKAVYDLIQENIRVNKEYALFEYVHGNTDVLDILKKIGDENKAIERATRLLEGQKDKDPINANPSTKVHWLVKELHEWIAYFSYVPE